MSIHLPETYFVQSEPEGSLAVLRSEYDAMQALGYGVLSDGKRVPSKLQGRGNLEEFHLAGRVFVIRRFRRGGLVRFVNRDRFLDPERPFEEIRLSLALRERGFLTPTVIAARARRIGILGYQLELVTERIEGAISLGRWLARYRTDKVETARLWRQLVSFGNLLGRLHASGFLHSDLQPENFLWGADDCERNPEDAAPLGAIWILDLDRSRFVPSGSLALAQRAQNLWRLWRYILQREQEGAVLRRSDYLRFLKSYEPNRAKRRALHSKLVALRSQRAFWHRC